MPIIEPAVVHGIRSEWEAPRRSSWSCCSTSRQCGGFREWRNTARNSPMPSRRLEVGFQPVPRKQAEVSAVYPSSKAGQEHCQGNQDGGHQQLFVGHASLALHGNPPRYYSCRCAPLWLIGQQSCYQRDIWLFPESLPNRHSCPIRRLRPLCPTYPV